MALAILMACLALLASARADAIPVGILVPYAAEDSAVPVRLANEWITAVRVALEVLGPKYSDTFTVDPHIQNSNCNYQDGIDAANALLNEGVVAVVGPACSEAAKGAATVFTPASIPFISFAATSDVFATDTYPTFFRTVYGDEHQAKAIKRVLQYFSWSKIYLFYTDETYGQGLSDSIQNVAAAEGIEVIQAIKVEYPPPANPDDYGKYFKDASGKWLTSDRNTIAVFATTPNAAEGLWTAAMTINGGSFLKYPWWFLGTDGATAFDLVGDGNALKALQKTLQGQIGLTPYKGNYNPHNSPFLDFKNYWQARSYDEYPGLLTLPSDPPFEYARPYVTNLIDAIYAYFVVFDKILNDQKAPSVSSDRILACLRDDTCAVFNGASGKVGFNKVTGDRSTDLQDAEYSFVNLLNVVWNEKGKLIESQESSFNPGLNYIMRPGPIPAGTPIAEIAAPSLGSTPPGADTQQLEAPAFQSPPPPASSSGGGMSGGAIAGIVIICVLGVAVIGFGVWWFMNRRRENHVENSEQFVRML